MTQKVFETPVAVLEEKTLDMLCEEYVRPTVLYQDKIWLVSGYAMEDDGQMVAELRHYCDKKTVYSIFLPIFQKVTVVV